MLGKRKSRILYVWLSRAFWGLLLYRTERGLHLFIGKPYAVIRIFLLPLINLIQAYSNLDINYKADIRGGLLVLHPTAGIVISGFSVIGENLLLTGGNVIGSRAGCRYGDIRIGNNCSLGANAVVLGPIKLSNNISVGASACVLKSCETDGATLVGVPAKIVGKYNTSDT